MTFLLLICNLAATNNNAVPRILNIRHTAFILKMIYDRRLSLNRCNTGENFPLYGLKKSASACRYI